MIHFGAKLLDATVLETHGVEHAGGGFRHARVGVAFAVGARGALDDEAAEAVEVDEIGELLAVAEGAAGGEHRVFQFEIVYVDVQHWYHFLRVEISNTGPSLQTQR